MSDKKRKVPKLRFPGFTDAWEQRKVGDFLTESRVKGSNGKVSKKLTVKLWGKGVVEKNTTYHGSEATQYYTRFSGQFIYGKLDFLNQAFGIIPEELDGYESTLDSPAFDVSPALNKDFFLDYVSREQFYLVQGIIANGSRKAKRIHSDTFFEMPILLPEFNEQKVISDFTSKFDSLISLHQRKLDNVKMLKKSLLQKLFPKDGEKIPELRFPGFTDDWEQRKLGNLVNTVKYKDYIVEANESGLYPVIQQGDRPILGYSNSDPITQFEDLVVFGDHTLSLFNPQSPFLLASDGVKVIRIPNFTGEFTYYILERYLPISQGYKRHYSVLKMQEVFFPAEYSERDRIGEFISMFDSLISLHQRKLDHLKELKKGLLQQMFV